jgi:hypothetical protein
MASRSRSRGSRRCLGSQDAVVLTGIRVLSFSGFSVHLGGILLFGGIVVLEFLGGIGIRGVIVRVRSSSLVHEGAVVVVVFGVLGFRSHSRIAVSVPWCQYPWRGLGSGSGLQQRYGSSHSSKHERHAFNQVLGVWGSVGSRYNGSRGSGFRGVWDSHIAMRNLGSWRLRS